MDSLIRKLGMQHGLVIGGAVIWGVIEFLALQRSARPTSRVKKSAVGDHAM